MPRKILVVDDNMLDLTVITGMLDNVYTVVRARNGKEAYSMLLNDPYSFSVVIADIMMPEMDGYQLCGEIRQSDLLRQIPVILATSMTDEETLARAMTCGANNYIKKPYAFALLHAIVNNCISLNESASIVNNMRFDKLTGILNRDAFMKEVARLTSQHEPGYYIISSFDVDHFKGINDQYGIAMGDEVLRHLASVLNEGCGAIGGISCRISDDRFAALYPASFRDSDVLDDIQTRVACFDALPSPISFTIGRYTVTDTSLAPSIMYDRAVLAGETIKDSYGIKVAYYDDTLRERFIGEQQIVSDMERALASGEFKPWFQPQYNHSTGALIGSEALVRWQKDGNIIPPSRFIEVFERNGFIYQVDRSVWRQVCEYLRRQIDMERSPLPISVNISRYDMFRKDFFDHICGLVKEYRLPIELLRLEVTESAFSESPQQIIEIVTRLVEFGFVVEIDDFGSGYSSLNTLKDVPAQVLKLDMRFLESNNSQRGGNIIESIVRMAKWLGMAVIAEGIEKLEQANYLGSIGCNYLQGYLYAKPMPAEEFEIYTSGYDKEERLLAMETVENLDQNAFWDPSSMDTLIFNSYVGSACILEYTKGRIEMIRATKHYIEMFGNAELGIDDFLGLDWGAYMDTRSFCRFSDNVTESKETKETVFGEYEFSGLPGCPKRTVIRGGVRVIAISGDRWLVYCISENITAQREAEEKEAFALRSREQAAEQMQAILDNVDVGVVASIYRNGTTEFLFANEKYFEMLGYTKPQFESEINDPYDTFAPVDRERARETFIDHMRCEEPGVIEATMLLRDGTERLFRDAFSTCHFVGIEEPVQLSIFRDVTDEREAELRDRCSVEQMSLIMKNVNCGICVIDMYSGNIPHFLFANEQFYSVAGYTREQVKAEISSFIDLVHPDDREKVGGVLAGILASETAVTFNFRCIRRDGAIAYLNSSVSFADLTGVGRVAILVQTDITDTIRSRESNERLANQLEVIINNTADSITAIAASDGELRLVFANDRYFEQLGVTREEFEARPNGLIDHITEADRERAAQILFKNGALGEKSSVEFRVLRDEEIRWMRSNINVVNYPGVEGSVQLAVTRDITEQVEAVLKEQQSAEELQAMMRDMPGGFVRMRADESGIYHATFCNDGFCRLLGYDHDELLKSYAEDPMAGVHPDDIAAVRSAVTEMKTKGEAKSSRYRLRKAGGDYVFVTVFGRVTRDRLGNSFLNLYYSNETTNEELERRREMMMDNLPWGAGAYTFRDGRIGVIYQNSSYCEFAGIEGDADASPGSIIHPDDMPIVMQKLDIAAKHGEDVICDIRIRHPKLGYRSVRLVARAVPDETEGFMIVATFVPNEQVETSYRHVLPVLLKTLMEMSGDYAFAKDVDLRYICCSPAFVKLAGLKSGLDVVGRSDHEIFPKDMADEFRKNDLALLESEEAMVDFDETVYSPDGTLHYCVASKYILRDGSGERVGIYGVSRDITKEKSALEQLRLVNDGIPGGIATYSFKDGELRIVYCNEGFCRLFGGTVEGFEKRAPFDPLEWVFEEDRAERMRQIRELVKNNTPIDIIYRIHTVDNGFKWINQKSSGVERRGDSVRFNAILLDITDRQIINEQLRISEEENALALKHGGGVICRFDVEERTLSIAPEIAMKYSLAERVADVPYQPVKLGLIAPESVDAYVGFFEDIIGGRRSGSVIYQQRYMSDWRWTEAKSTTVFSDDGRPTRAVISLFDVTDRLDQEMVYKKWQRSMAEKDPGSYTLFRCNLNRNATYEAKEGTLFTFDIDNAGVGFNDRSRAYADNCVFRDDRDGYIAFMDSDSMLAGYYRGKRSSSLDYREIMPDGVSVRWIRLTADLAEYPDSTDVEAYLMYEDVDDMKRGEFETTARMDNDPLTGILNRAAFEKKVNESITLSRPGAVHALLMLDIDGFKLVNDVFGHGAGDRMLIDVALKIRKAIRSGDHAGRLGGDEFVVFLSDILNENIAAIKAKQICEVAKKDFSVEVQTTGSVGIAIYPSDGSDFASLYKRADAALYYVKGSGKDDFAFYRDDMEVASNGERQGIAELKRLDIKRRMLIADDSRMSCEMLAELFADDFRVDMAFDGASALTKIHHYGAALSVILLDLVMPKMDGYNVLDKMQKDAEMRGIPVIVITASDDRETVLKAMSCGASDLVTKPIDPDILRIRVNSAINKVENERLRAQNRLLTMLNDEIGSYQTVLEQLGMAVVVNYWIHGNYLYSPSVSKMLYGRYDDRRLWRILLSDMVADTVTVQRMQQLVHDIANDRDRSGGEIRVDLKAKSGRIRSFDMNVFKHVNEFGLADRMILAFHETPDQD